MLRTCFGLNRPSSGQYFTEMTGNYNMSYTYTIKTFELRCGYVVITTPQHRDTPGDKDLIF